MSKQRVSVPLTTAAQRRLLFETWQQTGNVTVACRTANVCRRTFYYWKPRFDAGGYPALDTFRFSVRPRPHQSAEAVVEHAIALRREHPTWGKQRIADELAKRNGGVPLVSANTVKRLLVDAGLWPAHTTAHHSRTAPTPDLAQPVRTTVPAPRDAALTRVTRPVPLLATKLARPRDAAPLVVRSRLLDRLDRATEQRLTLVSAAAGWGKTTLLSAWAGRQSRPVAWLSLDELDNDATRLWSAVIAALRSVLPSLGTTTLAMLGAPQPAPVAAVVTTLLNELAALELPDPVVLIVDDYHVLDDLAVHTGVALMVDHLPPQLRVVLASRVDPQLPLARWRVRGHLAELRGAELSFSVAEARAFFTHALGDELADDEVERLAQRTEGWIAGLQLAALALRGCADRSTFVQTFSGSHRYLFDYVQEEILERQPLLVQRFLLHTAVLRRLNAAVCTALTDEPRSQAMLERLERSHLFVVPLDEQRQWFRVHDLFRDVLLARLQATDPEHLQRLHQRAAHWYATHGQEREAIAHALAAADFAAAACLIEREAPRLWLHGEARTVHGWIAALPDVVVRRHARLALDAALRLVEVAHGTVHDFYSRAHADVAQTMWRLDAWLGRHPDVATAFGAHSTLPQLSDAEVTLLRRRMSLLDLLLVTRAIVTAGDTDRMHAIAAEAAELSAYDGALSWKLIALSLSFWLTETLQREGALLIPQLVAARQQAIAAQDPLATVRVMRWLALAYLRAGRLRLAQRECRAALSLHVEVDQFAVSRGYFCLYLGTGYLATNQLDKASEYTAETLRIAHTWQHVDLLSTGYVYMLRIALAQGDLAGAEQALQQADALHRLEPLAANTGMLNAARVRYWLAAGKLDAAWSWANQAVFSAEHWAPNRKWEVLMLVRVHLALQQNAAALETLDRFRSELDRPGDGATAIEYLALHAVALDACAQPEHANAVAARLLALTAPDGSVRVFLDGGEAMRRLLRRLHHLPRDGQTTLPTASVTFVTHVLAAFAHTPQQDDAPVLPAPLNCPAPLVEPLTRREQEVLRLLLDGASNSQIAAELVIARATVKKHVGNILAKLEVTSRTQAIARARSLPDLA